MQVSLPVRVLMRPRTSSVQFSSGLTLQALGLKPVRFGKSDARWGKFTDFVSNVSG